MRIICLDLEGVLVPEIWVGLADATGIDELRTTTRDIGDYDELMRIRLELLRHHQLGLADLRRVIDGLAPLPGATEFLARLRNRFQLAILSDTFYEFAAPLMRQLGQPLLLCHHLELDSDGSISGYRLRQEQPKLQAVRAFQSLGYRVFAAGDSLNDIDMLRRADFGAFFRAPEAVRAQHAQFPATEQYDELWQLFCERDTAADRASAP